LFYQIGENVSGSLNLLCLGFERNDYYYNKYFVNEYIFYTKEYGNGKKSYNSGVYIKRSTSNEFEVDYYAKLEKVTELQYCSEYNKVFYIQMLLIWYYR